MTTITSCIEPIGQVLADQGRGPGQHSRRRTGPDVRRDDGAQLAVAVVRAEPGRRAVHEVARGQHVGLDAAVGGRALGRERRHAVRRQVRVLGRLKAGWDQVRLTILHGQ